MTPIYLTGLELRDFRSYRDATTLSFAPEPGLTVIVGPNGLGKSTLFDAVEWGLTGQLRRFDDVDAREKERRHSIGEQPVVGMSFSDGASLLRERDRFALAQAQGLDLPAWLAAPGWEGLSNLGDCLKLTHFLGQSTRQLFVHMDGKQRWNLLEGPAGLQSLWAMEQALGRPKTRQALAREEEAQARRLAEVTQTRQEFERLQEELRRKRALARAGASIAPAEITERCRDMLAELLRTCGGETVPDIADVDALLRWQQARLEDAGLSEASLLHRLRQWQGQVDELADLEAASAQQSTAMQAVDGQLADEARQAHQLAARAQTAQAAREAYDKSSAELRKRQQTALAVLQAYAARSDKQARQRELAAARAALASRLDGHAQALDQQRQSLSTLQNLRRRHGEAVAQLDALDVLRVQVAAFLAMAEPRDHALVALEALPATQQQLRAAQSAQAVEVARLEGIAEATRRQRDAIAADTSAMAAAVAQIAAALTEDACACPVCATAFPVGGQLKQLAVQQAQQASQRLAGLESALQRADADAAQARQALRGVELQQAALHRQQAEWHAAIAAAREEKQRLLSSDGLLAGLAEAEMLPRLMAAVEECDRSVLALQHSLSQLPDEARMRAQLAELESQQRSLTQQQAEYGVQLASLEAELAQLEARVAGQPDAEVMQQELHAIEQTVMEREVSAAGWRGDLQQLAEERSASLARQQALHARREQLGARLLELRKLVADLRARWRADGFDGEPDLAAVAGALQAYKERQAFLAQAQRAHAALVAGRAHYLADRDLGMLEQELAALLEKHEAVDEGALLAVWDRQAADIAADMAALRRVREGRERLLGEMQQRNDDIRRTVSAPLNECVGKFCAALMSDRNYQISLDAVASATSAQALLSFLPEGGDAAERKNPLLFLSEGQLAAVNLCLLLGASVTYPWSRWKALLLDDPLHHNDSIHAAAFIDVMRNLIRHQGYQIIVSTHDMNQAGYFLRKCRNAGIPSRYLHLYGRTENGTALSQEGGFSAGTPPAPPAPHPAAPASSHARRPA